MGGKILFPDRLVEPAAAAAAADVLGRAIVLAPPVPASDQDFITWNVGLVLSPGPNDEAEVMIIAHIDIVLNFLISNTLI